MTQLCTGPAGPQPPQREKPCTDAAVTQLLARIEDAAAAQRIRELQVTHQALTTHRRAWSHYADWDSAAAAQAGQAALEALVALGAKPLDQIKPKRARVRKSEPEPTASFDVLENGDLFADRGRWPRKPYCKDEKDGAMLVRSLQHAVLRRYIQANPPHLRIWSLFDIDRAGGGLAWEDAGLPPPAWAAISRDTGRAHLAWGLTVPVLVDAPSARQGPLRYLCGVESLMRERMEADDGFGGLITKNPAHPHWKLLRGPQLTYTLGELAEALPGLEKHIPKRGKVEEVGLGRNVSLFDGLRLWAYRAIRAAWRDFGHTGKAAELWGRRVESHALKLNGDFKTPLMDNEVAHIAKSVSRYTWGRFSPQGFAEYQANAGRRGGVASGQARREGSVSEAAPWDALGISRATWYRRNKAGLLVPDSMRHEAIYAPDAP